MTVYILQTIDYPSDTIMYGVFSSVDAALNYLKESHKPPYIVEWGNVKLDDSGVATIEGKFEAVLHYSTEHTKQFEVTPYELDQRA